MRDDDRPRQGEGDDYSRWAAGWISQALDTEDVEEWESGQMTDHVFSLLEAVGIGRMQIVADPHGEKTVVVIDN